ncbi:membrane protein [Tateyamaria omphalii]|uniref:MAPEG family protein n=1 Tax=Tateyamaria omphalii TaxID=299262 RepID=UPI001673363D|nr:MAPEG family protein [Tateyamaria omphalii]GGX50065.1 membrane protein [Tateyamaria omphalii]
MPTELVILGVLAVMAVSLWIPYIVGVNTAPEGSIPADAPDGFIIPPDPNVHRPWVRRAYRAHLNLLEQSVPFAILVFLVDRADGFTALTLWASIAFLLLRIAHAVGYITGTARFPARPLIFTAGWICCLLMAWAFFAA